MKSYNPILKHLEVQNIKAKRVEVAPKYIPGLLEDQGIANIKLAERIAQLAEREEDVVPVISALMREEPELFEKQTLMDKGFYKEDEKDQTIDDIFPVDDTGEPIVNEGYL